jgi:DNA ligase 1
MQQGRNAVQLSELARTWRAVADESGRRQKVLHLVEALAGLAPQEVQAGVSLLSGELPGGPVGVGWAKVQDAAKAPPAAAESLTVQGVQGALQALRDLKGKGASGERSRRLYELFGAATGPEQLFLRRLLVGELRQGALEGVMHEAIAAASGAPLPAVRRASMLSGALPAVAKTALVQGAGALSRYRLELFVPVSPMLASAAADAGDAIARLGEAAFEHKLDGARVQVHKHHDEVRVFSRRLHDVTARVPELVACASALPARSLVLDGEVLALGAGGRPLPFQVTMRRFGRRLAVERLAGELPLSAFFFDVLHLDGQDLLDEPAAVRALALAEAVPTAARVGRREGLGAEGAAAFLDEALAAGHEGLVAKSLTSPYEAGRRGAAWLKLKPAHTLDLVVLAAEWGSGRRHGTLSNLHLGAGDGEGGFVMLGKTFTGLSDELLRWQTKRLLELELARDAATVFVRPELVVEVAFDGTQKSAQYPSGLALRFARVKRYRPDKRPEDADLVASVRGFWLKGP